MIALHARKSHASIARFAETKPTLPLIVVLTGTDLYRDIQNDESAQESLRLATRLVVLQKSGLRELTSELREKTSVIYQSTLPIPPQTKLSRCFEVCVSGHLRDEKDPFRAALALRYLPVESRICVTHFGGALTGAMAREAESLMRQDSRYRWLGELPHGRARRKLARARLMVISSYMEGGANVIVEAIIAKVPVIASRVPGNFGMLGENYAGYYPLGDERALAALLTRAESDGGFYRLLKRQCAARKSLFSPNKEKAALLKVLKRAFSDCRNSDRKQPQT